MGFAGKWGWGGQTELLTLDSEAAQMNCKQCWWLLVPQTAQASPALVPVVTQNRTPAMHTNQGAASAAKSNLERAARILKGLHWGVGMHADR